jgi:uncharacterized protein YjdB
MHKRKSVPFVISAVLAFSTASLILTSVVSCGEVETQEVVLTVTTESFTLVEGENAQIGVTVTGTDNTVVTYAVSKGSGVVSVSDNGLITALAKGSATITVTSVADTSKTAAVEVTVKENVIAVTAVTIDEGDNLELERGETKQLNVTITPDNATDKSVTWSSDTASVATVDSTGLVTAIGVGNVTITVTSGEFSDSIIVTVYAHTEAIEITTSEDDAKISVGGTKKIEYIIDPTYSTDAVVWSSSNESVATVDSTGLVTAIAVGQDTITVTSGGFSDSVLVTIYAHTQGIDITTTAEDAKIFIGATKQIEYIIDPTYSTDAVVWSSSDESVATVDENGLVSGLAEGSATITVTSNGKSDSIVFNIYPELFDKEEGTTYRYYDELSDNPSVVSGAGNGASDVETLPLNIAASTTYYMEADVSLDYDPWVDSGMAGFANFADEYVLNETPYYGVAVSNAFTNQFDWAHKWGNVVTFTNEVSVTDYTRQFDIITNYNVPSYDLSEIGSTVKLATARVGDTFYSFVNGVYMQSGVVEALAGIPTRPGFMSVYTNVKYQNIDYFSGEDAVDKLASLGQNDASDLLRYEKRYGDSEAQAVYGDTIKVDETDGLTFTSQATVGMNSSILTPDLSVFGDGYVEATYSDFALSDASSTGNIGICIRQRDRSQMTMGRFVIKANNGDLNDLKIQAAWGDKEWQTVNIVGDATSFDASQGIKLRIERHLSTSGSDFTITRTSVANPEQIYSQTYTYSVTDYDYCYNQFAFQFFSEQVEAKASHVSWGALSE